MKAIQIHLLLQKLVRAPSVFLVKNATKLNGLLWDHCSLQDEQARLSPSIAATSSILWSVKQKAQLLHLFWKL